LGEKCSISLESFSKYSYIIVYTDKHRYIHVQFIYKSTNNRHICVCICMYIHIHLYICIGELFWVRNAVLVSKVSANIHTAIERLVDSPVVIPTCLMREEPEDNEVPIYNNIYIYIYIYILLSSEDILSYTFRYKRIQKYT
jgi:hypothetical protein